MRTSASSFMNVKVLTRNNKGFLMSRPVALGSDKYVGLDLTLIRYIKTSAGIRLES